MEENVNSINFQISTLLISEDMYQKNSNRNRKYHNIKKKGITIKIQVNIKRGHYPNSRVMLTIKIPISS